MAVHSALSLPLIVGDEVIGAINSYAHSRDAFGEHAVQLGSQFAGPAAVSVYNAQLLDRRAGADAAAAAGVGEPRGDRSGDRDHPQPVRRERRGGVRPADADQPGRERQAASSSPSGWWRRRCGAPGRGAAVEYDTFTRWPSYSSLRQRPVDKSPNRAVAWALHDGSTICNNESPESRRRCGPTSGSSARSTC